MGLVELQIMSRSTTGKNANRRSRQSGQIPAVLYGQGRATENVALDTVDFNRAMLALAGSSVIFSLKQEGVDEGSIALLRDVQRNPITDEILHVDLFEIPRGKPITVDVTIRIEGESLAVKRGDANIALIVDTVELSCLPSELPEYISVDVTDLEVNDKIFVKDLTAPVGEIMSDPEALVVNLKPPAIFVSPEEEAAEAEALAEAEEGVEGEEGEEGAADQAESDGGKDEKSEK